MLIIKFPQQDLFPAFIRDLRQRCKYKIIKLKMSMYNVIINIYNGQNQ